MDLRDEVWMRRALELAERGRGLVEPNPLVGAVLVCGDQIVGEGWHARFGQAHAEANALTAAGEAAAGSTLYVTLEPCCHHGKTPPCTDALIRARVQRVVAALEDPFPQVAGRGAMLLRQAGIDVDFGLCADPARRQNAAYLKLLRTGVPYVHAKWAMSLDGKIATRAGDSKWISNESSRRKVHELRGRMDAIIVGIGTALADNPLLTARPPGPRIATRVVLDSHARLPTTSQLVRTAGDFPTLIVVSESSLSAAVGLRASGSEIVSLPGDTEGRPDLHALLLEFGRRRWTNVLVEGGAGVLGAFFDADAIDEAHVYLAPKLIGGAQAKSPVGGVGVELVAQCSTWSSESLEMLDGDVYLRCVRA